jgi:hypothetical protein
MNILLRIKILDLTPLIQDQPRFTFMNVRGLRKAAFPKSSQRFMNATPLCRKYITPIEISSGVQRNSKDTGPALCVR